jgi:hypothetical protein
LDANKGRFHHPSGLFNAILLTYVSSPLGVKVASDRQQPEIIPRVMCCQMHEQVRRERSKFWMKL